MSLDAIHAAIRSRLSTIDGLAVFDAPPMHATPPVAVVLPPSIDYHQSFGSPSTRLQRAESDLWLVTAATAWSDAAVEAAWPYMDATGSKSIIAALYGEDRTLGGVVEALLLRSARPLQDDIGGVAYFGVSFTIEFQWRAS
jgi:hypothetical protein